MAENTSLAFEVRHLPANNCLKTPAYANAMQILGYPRPANTSSHFVTELQALSRTAKTIPKLPALIRFQWNFDKNATISVQ